MAVAVTAVAISSRFKILKGEGKKRSRVQTLDCKTDFSFYRELVDGSDLMGGNVEGQGSSGKLASLQDSTLQNSPSQCAGKHKRRQQMAWAKQGPQG